MKNLYRKLMLVQSELVAPKNQRNNFGRFNYRSSEDILEALKPLLRTNELTLVISDSIKQVGDRHYVEAECKLIDNESGESIIVTAYARESIEKKGMDLAQVTGSTSSYARKYALNGMFCIDDNKDPDYTSKGEGETTREVNDALLESLYELADNAGISKEATIKTLTTKYKVKPEYITMVQYTETVKTLGELKQDKLKKGAK